MDIVKIIDKEKGYFCELCDSKSDKRSIDFYQIYNFSKGYRYSMFLCKNCLNELCDKWKKEDDKNEY